MAQHDNEFEQLEQMTLQPEQRSRVQWACRRGMKELDLALMPFFDYEYDSLTRDQQMQFIKLLYCADPDLFNWLMNKGEPNDDDLKSIIKLIQTRNKERGAVAF